MMDLKINCKTCAGPLFPFGDGQCKCRNCGNIYETKSAEDYADQMRRMFDEQKLEAIDNARRNLYEAVTAEHISSEEVRECCRILKQLYPDDFQANFYEIAVGNNVRQIAKTIRRIKTEDTMDYMDTAIAFLIRSLQTEYQLELSHLIARAYESRDPVKYERYCTMLSKEAEKVDGGVYETKLPRQVFVAYSSKDMEAVEELTEVLETQGLKCFVAARNLRHGKGAVENYNEALAEAMDHCRSVVFVSSTNSRSFNCDALTIELPYIQKKDIDNAPAEYKNDYKSLPQRYKKPRVEYRIGDSTANNIADVISNEIFDGYERAYSPEEVAARVMKQLVSLSTVPSTPAPKKEVKKTKICTNCLSECPENAKFCMNCGGNSFAKTKEEAELKKQIETLKKEKEELEKEKQNVKTPPKPPVIPPSPSIAKKPKEIKATSAVSIEKSPSSESKRKTPASTAAPSSPEQPVTFSFPASQGLELELCKDTKSYSVTDIGSCKDTEIVIPSSHKDKPVICIDYGAFRGQQKVTKVILPDSIKKIHTFSFADCSMLTEIIIPNSVTSIGEKAFENCLSLTSITIPNSVKSIGKEAFSGCKKLKTVVMPDNPIKIGDWAFFDCPGSPKNIPRATSASPATRKPPVKKKSTVSIKQVEKNEQTESKGLAFNGDTVIGIGKCADSNIIIPSTNIRTKIKRIGNSAFENQKKITGVTIPNTVTTIGSFAFYNCSNLRDVILPDSLAEIESGAFDQCESLTEIAIPENVKTIGGSAFNGCSRLTGLSLPKEIKIIEDSMFRGCTNITSITIPKGVASIQAHAFDGCSKLTKITIPNSVTSIGSSAFSGCISLTSITIPDSVENIGLNVFANCNSLREIIFENPDGWKKLGVLFSSKIPIETLSDPPKAASALKTQYLKSGIYKA